MAFRQWLCRLEHLLAPGTTRSSVEGKDKNGVTDDGETREGDNVDTGPDLAREDSDTQVRLQELYFTSRATTAVANTFTTSK